MRAAPEIVYTIILAAIFFVLLVTVIIVTVWRYYSRKRAHEMEVIQFGQTLLETRLEIQEHTFRAISEELHDNLGQVLSLAKLQLNTANINNPIQAQEKVNGAIDLVGQAIYSIRDLAKTMHSESITRVGLTGALETEARLIEKIGMLQPVFQVSGTPVPLDDNKTLIVFRIVQEALHNVVKHANATLVEMKVDFSKDQVRVTVRDNGSGFHSNGNNDGSGLRNMKDRAKIIGAEFDLQSVEDKGTTIILTIPSI